MAADNVLVLLLHGGSKQALRRAIAARDGEPPTVHVVAPAHVGALEWLASDEDAARHEAGVRSLEAEWLLADQAQVDGEAGDVDPVVAVEDALRQFRADEILIVGGEAEDGTLERSLRRLGVPVTRVGPAPPSPRHPRLAEGSRAIVGGRSRATPFVFFAGVNLFLLLLAAVIAGLALLALWLAY